MTVAFATEATDSSVPIRTAPLTARGRTPTLPPERYPAMLTFPSCVLGPISRAHLAPGASADLEEPGHGVRVQLTDEQVPAGCCRRVERDHLGGRPHGRFGAGDQ